MTTTLQNRIKGVTGSELKSVCSQTARITGMDEVNIAIRSGHNAFPKQDHQVLV